MKKAAQSPDADVRIVVVSSNATYLVPPRNYPLDFTTADVLYGKLPYTPLLYRLVRTFVFNVNMLHYAVSKLANALFAKELQRRMTQQGLPIAVLAVHPGGVRSPDVHKVFKPWIWPLISGNFISSDAGSHSLLFAATARQVREEPDKYLGSYMEPIGVVHHGHPLMGDMEQAGALWKTTQAEVDKYGKTKGNFTLMEW
jgi:NAD(P)-dependent dehydrogenase (short-subunit alcohol dehydrogenase family)